MQVTAKHLAGTSVTKVSSLFPCSTAEVSMGEGNSVKVSVSMKISPEEYFYNVFLEFCRAICLQFVSRFKFL